MAPKTQKTAQLHLPDGSVHELPVLNGAFQKHALDIRSLYKATGFTAYDPGYTSTASCKSAITYIDGAKGDLYYRGYPVKKLADHNTFLEVAHLLWEGELPEAGGKNPLEEAVRSHSMVHEQLREFFKGFRRDAHPMAILMGTVGALSSFYHEDLNLHNEDDRDLAAIRILAKMPTLAAMAYRYNKGLPFVYPCNELSYVENFVYMMFDMPTQPYKADDVRVKALEKVMILHADHEQNASTSTVRMAASSHADPFGCIAAGVASLWGPAHGGANEAVLRMLAAIQTPENIPIFLEKAKDKADPFKLMGFGHRVYKNYDPRAHVLKEVCHTLLKHLGLAQDPLFKLALELEKVALNDPYFIEKKLYPNVDFYSGLVLQALGIPLNMFTVLFAVARTTGWLAHWKELFDDEDFKIGRPQQLYVGPEARGRDCEESEE